MNQMYEHLSRSQEQHLPLSLEQARMKRALRAQRRADRLERRAERHGRRASDARGRAANQWGVVQA